MLKKLSLYTAILLFTATAIADPITPLNKGQAAPFEGLLVPTSTMNKITKDLDTKDLLETKVLKLEDLASAHSERAEFYKKEYLESQKELRSQESTAFYKGTAFFIFGAVLTGAISYATIRASR